MMKQNSQEARNADNIRLLVPGATIRPGSVGEVPFVTFSDMPVVEMMVDVTDPGRRAIGTFAVVTNPTAVYTGALVVAGTQAAPAIPVIDNVVNAASFGLDGLGSAGAILTIFGSNFGSADDISLFPATAFNGLRVTFDGVPVPLFAVVTSQLFLPIVKRRSGTSNSINPCGQDWMIGLWFRSGISISASGWVISSHFQQNWRATSTSSPERWSWS